MADPDKRVHNSDFGILPEPRIGDEMELGRIHVTFGGPDGMKIPQHHDDFKVGTRLFCFPL